MSYEQPGVPEQPNPDDKPQEGEALLTDWVSQAQAPNIAPFFLQSDEGKKWLGELAKKVCDETNQGWDDSEEFRTKRREIQRLYTGFLKKKTFPFDGCANVHSPLMLERIMRLSANVFAEIFSERDMIFGVKATGPDDYETAEVLSIHGNWQLRQELTDFLTQMDKAVTLFFLDGSVFCYSWYDKARGRNRHDILTCEDMVIPFAWQTDLVDMSDIPWKTRIVRKYRHEVDEMADEWAQVGVVTSKNPPVWDFMESKNREMGAEMEGLRAPDGAKGAPYIFFEYHGWMRMPGEQKARPICATVSADHKIVTKLYIRDEEDWRDRDRFDKQSAELNQFQQDAEAFPMAMQQYKAATMGVGSRVRVTGAPHMQEQAGAEGVVAEMQGNAVGVLFDGTTEVHRWYTPEELELLSPSPQMGQPQMGQPHMMPDGSMMQGPPMMEMGQMEPAAGQPMPPAPEPPMPPTPPSWAQPDETGALMPPEPIKRVPLEMFSHGKCAYNPGGMLGLSYGHVLANFNEFVDEALNRFYDSATLNNVWSLVLGAGLSLGESKSIAATPGKIFKATGVGSDDLGKSMKELRAGPPSPDLMNLTREAMGWADSAVAAPGVLSGEPGKSGETFRGIATRVEKATKQLTSAGTKFLQFLEQILKNNARLNYYFMDEETLVRVNDHFADTRKFTLGPDGSPLAELTLTRDMYRRNYDVSFTADVRFTSQAQKIAEADEVLAMVNSVFPPIPPGVPMQDPMSALRYHAVAGALRARGKAELIPLLGPPPPLPEAPMGTPVMPPPPPPGMGLPPGDKPPGDDEGGGAAPAQAAA